MFKNKWEILKHSLAIVFVTFTTIMFSLMIYVGINQEKLDLVDVSYLNEFKKENWETNSKQVVKLNVERNNLMNQGSGVVLSVSDNLIVILSNAHVLVKKDKEVTLVYITDHAGNKEYFDSFEIISSDEYDLALLIVEPKELDIVPVAFAKSSTKRNDVVFAIGSPGGVLNVLTYGKIKNPKGSRNVKNMFIRHTVELNPGNSGGALFNERGELVGINAAISTSYTYYSGKYLSIPLEHVTKFLNQLKK